MAEAETRLAELLDLLAAGTFDEAFTYPATHARDRAAFILAAFQVRVEQDPATNFMAFAHAMWTRTLLLLAIVGGEEEPGWYASLDLSGDRGDEE